MITSLPRSILTLLAIMALLHSRPAAAQAGQFASDAGPEHYAWYGIEVSPPSQLAGLWEAADGHGGAVGVFIHFGTELQGTRKSFIEPEQKVRSFGVGLFRRTGEDYEWKWFTGSPSVTWNGYRLEVRNASTLPYIHVNVTYDSKSLSWTGLFHVDEFSEEVVLRRPEAHNNNLSPFIGTWSMTDLSKHFFSYVECIHIVGHFDNTLSGWRDHLPGLGNDAYYGDRLNLRLDGDTLELTREVPVASSYLLRLRSSPDGKLYDLASGRKWVRTSDDCSFPKGEYVRTGGIRPSEKR